jgi:hypothetical protein
MTSSRNAFLGAYARTMPKTAAAMLATTPKGATAALERAAPVLEEVWVALLEWLPVEDPLPLLPAAGKVAVLTAEVEVAAVAVPRVQVKYHP